MAKQSTKNPLSGYEPSADEPATDAVAVTPSDTDDLPFAARALYIGVTGDVNVVMANDDGGTAVLFKAVPVGILPVAVRKVKAASTTATNIVALA